MRALIAIPHFFFLLALVVPTTSNAWECSWLVKPGSWFHLKKKPIVVPVPTEVTDQRVLKWFQKPHAQRDRLASYIGTRIPFKDQHFEIIQPLGWGGEANVFLVKTPEGLRSAKVFKQNSVTMKQNAHDMRNPRPEQAGLNHAKVIDLDEENTTLLLEYIEGIPVMDLMVHGKYFGLTESEIETIMAAANATGLFKYNLVYRFQDQKIFVIDPY